MADQTAPTLPRAEIGLFQSDLEVLGTPAHDLDPFLRGNSERWGGTERWGVQSLDERTIAGAIGEHPRIDALVVGFNALHQSGETVKDAFKRRRPPGNLMILHQLGAGSFEFLTGDLGLDVRELPGREVRPIRFPLERDVHEEPLLNWPRPLARRDNRVVLEGRALRSFSPAADSVWRVVLEMEHDGESFPVLMRTARVVPERVVVCSLLLEWRDPVHADLLENMLTYCALGSPQVAVLSPSEGGAPDYDPALLANRLRLRGARAFVVPVKSAKSIQFDSWPLRSVRHIVGPDSIVVESVLGSDAPHAWARAGGALTRVGPGGELTLHSRATDARWVAERWAAWYRATSPELWQKSLHASRAVLRMLAAVHALPDAGPLGLEAPQEYPEQALAGLLKRRVHNGSCEETISTTGATLDIDRLLGGGGLLGTTKDNVENWLRAAFSEAPGGGARDDPAPPVEDQLDIARALRDPVLLEIAWERMEQQPVTALSLTRMREALVACREELVARGTWDRFQQLPGAVKAGIDGDAVVAAVYGRVLVSAEFLNAAAELHSAVPDHPAANLNGRAVQAAVETISSRSAVARLETLEESDASPIGITTEALALLRHMTALPTTTRQIHPESEGLPVQVVQEVLHEARESRELVQRESLAREALGRATWLLGAGSVAAMSLIAARVFGWAHVSWPDVAFLGGGFLAGLAALLIVSRIRARRGDPTPALAGDVLGAVGLAIAACVGYVVLKLKPTAVDALDTIAALLVFGLGVLLVLFLLRVAGLSPMWTGWLRRQLNSRNVPFFGRSSEPADPP